MGEKIYRLILVNRRAKWLELSEEEQDKKRAWMEKTREEYGGKVILACYSRWSSEHMPGFAVEEFPDIESEQQYVQALEQKGWFQYHKATTYIGTKWEG
jgi:hypothetical protein